MDNSKFKFKRDVTIGLNPNHDIHVVVGRVFDYDAEDFFYILEDHDGALVKYSVAFVENHFHLIAE